MPRMAHFLSNRRSRDSEDLMDKMMIFCTMLGCGMAFGIAAVGQEFAVIFYGQAFARTGLFLVLLSPAVIFKCLSLTIRMQYIIPSKKDDLYVISIISGAVLNLILNFILIPCMQGDGAIIATLAAEFTAVFLEFVLCGRSIRSGRYLTDLLVFCSLGTAMYFFVRAIAHIAGGGIAGLALQVLGGAAFYILISVIFIRNRLDLTR
jgi:O-antigen/teichoic acid export membrane protein